MKLELMWRDILMTTIEFDEESYKKNIPHKHKVIKSNTTEVPEWRIPFRFEEYVTNEDLTELFLDRIFEQARQDRNKILDILGLDGYNPLEIAKKTHGVLYDDFEWMRFGDEEVTFEDVRIR